MWTPDRSIISTVAQREADALADAWSNLRAERDRRIAACDFTQLPDWPGDAAAWAEYRQALRDLPAQTDMDPDHPVWPESPS